MNGIYLDHAATTPLRPSALEAYTRAALETGNAASTHRAGQAARELLEEGRARAAAALGVRPLELLFNSGGTEGDNHALLALARLFPGGHLVTVLTEHSAVLEPARLLESLGYPVTFLKPDAQGRVHPDALAAALRDDTFLVSVAHANNEIGTVQDIAALAEVAHARGARFHTDAVQSPGVLEVAPTRWNVDLASFSAHKWGGPKGVGLLYVRRGLDLPPLLLGGGQERGLRGGTHNVAGAYAAAISLEEALREQPAEHERLRALQRRLEAGLRKVPGVSFNHPPDGNPKVVSVTLEGADGEALLMNLDLEGVYASLGSACSAGTMQPSHVLLALGMSERQARSTLRFSLGRTTTEADIDAAVAAFERVAARVVV